MNNDKQIEIKLSKSKLTLSLIGSATFVGLGIWFLLRTPTSNIAPFNSSIFIKVVGIISILFFGIVFIFLIKKLQDKKPGLIITDTGIIDNSSGVSAGIIPWSDISEIKLRKVFNQKFLMLLVNNPQDYIDRQTNSLKRSTMGINYRSYGSPIAISTNGLACKFDELKNILENKLTEFNANRQNV
ncbi:MAG: hypothetical protein KGO81_10475 [Bacteroidota bacterium]|nr:hypothetical protein [Bacteroidota bacterium]